MHQKLFKQKTDLSVIARQDLSPSLHWTCCWSIVKIVPNAILMQFIIEELFRHVARSVSYSETRVRLQCKNVSSLFVYCCRLA